MDEQQLIEQARAISSPDKRRALLDSACADDPQLRARIEAALAGPAKNSVEWLSVDPLAADSPLVVAPSSTVEHRPGASTPLRNVGPYKLLHRIGEGGMGTVYMAEQAEPVRRRVALKLMKPGLDSAQVLARFEAERQALAMMDHPNIARVLDAGTTGHGLPYFVMELVKGVPITQFCDDNRLTLRERLELFVPVCLALQHAHQKGIIHRDVKPSNVLVALYDGQPVSKVIDFGVAKALFQRLTDRTLFTEFGQIVGTLEYMSPEQAEMNALDVDTRTDVYSLGVLLYELLTGSTPLEHKRVREAALDELLKLIREEEPPRPSTRLSFSQETLPTISTQRKLEPAQLTRLVRGELDWIVMKALEKDRSRRYDSAGSFAADVDRYLRNEPVEACPPSTGYRLRKFAGRYKAALAVLAVVLLLVTVGAGVSVWQAVRATRAERDAVAGRDRAVQAEALAKASAKRAESAERQARDEAAIAQAVSDFLQNDLLAQASSLAQADRKETPDPDVKVRTLLDRAVANVWQRFVDRPVVEAAVHETIGRAYLDLGQPKSAVMELRKAIELYQREIGPESPRTLAGMSLLAAALKEDGEYIDAASMWNNVFAIQQRVLGPNHKDTLTTRARLVNDGAFGSTADKVVSLRDVLDEQLRTLGAEHPTTLMTMEALASQPVLKPGEAEKLCQDVLKVRQRVLGPEHPDTLRSKQNLAAVQLKREGKYVEAEVIYRETLDKYRSIFGSEHPQTLGTAKALASVLKRIARFDEAEKLYVEVLEIERRLLGDEDNTTEYTKLSLGEVYNSQGRFLEAEGIFARLLARQERSHQGVITSYELVRDLEAAYRGQGKLADVERMYRALLTMRMRKGRDLGGDELTLNLAVVVADQERYREAEEMLEHLVAIRTEETNGSGGFYTLEPMQKLAGVYRDLGEHSRAEPLFRRIIAGYRKLKGVDHVDTFKPLSDLATNLRMQRKYDDAEPLNLELCKLAHAKQGPEGAWALTADNNLAVLRFDQGRFDDAEVLFKRVLDIRRRKFGPEHRDTLTLMGSLASTYVAQNRVSEAILLYEERAAIGRKKLGPDHAETVQMLSRLAPLYEKVGGKDRALNIYRAEVEWCATRKAMHYASNFKALLAVTRFELQVKKPTQEIEMLLCGCLRSRLPSQLSEQGKDAVSVRLQFSMSDLTEVYWLLTQHLLLQQRSADAEAIARKFDTDLGTRPPGNGPVVYWMTWKTQKACAQSLLGATLTQQGRYPEAEDLLLKAADLYLNDKDIIELDGAADRRLRTLHWLIELYDAWDKPTQEAEWKAMLVSWEAAAANKPADAVTSDTPPPTAATTRPVATPSSTPSTTATVAPSASPASLAPAR